MKKKQGHFHTDAFTRGGQIFSHEWRMRLQNFRTVALIGLCCGSVGMKSGFTGGAGGGAIRSTASVRRVSMVRKRSSIGDSRTA